MFLRSSEGRTRVSSVEKVKHGPCEEFDMWLVRGEYEEGDDVIVNHDDAVRDAVDE